LTKQPVASLPGSSS